MKINTKQEILDVLAMPEEAFWRDVAPAAHATYRAARGDELTVTSMLGYSNICKNLCLYCGMRAANQIPRYRIPPEDVLATLIHAYAQGFRRAFLISGEDLGYGFDKLLRIVEGAHRMGLFLSLACGEFTAAQYAELRAAGADEYVIKFEMSHRESFNRLNPSTDYDKRLAAIAAVQASGMRLASGNINGWPGQTADELADDLLLMRQLGISWAPVIPYMPAQGTPLAAEGGRGDLLTNLKEIAVLRLMMPDINITAQQPGRDPKTGLADEEGNCNAIRAGANILFCDLLPAAKERNFRVIDERHVTGTEHLYRIAALTQMKLSF